MANHLLPTGVKKASNSSHIWWCSPLAYSSRDCQHSWAPYTEECMVKLISRDIYAWEKTSKGYGRNWGIFSDGHSSARKSIWCLDRRACKPEDESFRTVPDWRIFFQSRSCLQWKCLQHPCLPKNSFTSINALAMSASRHQEFQKSLCLSKAFAEPEHLICNKTWANPSTIKALHQSGHAATDCRNAPRWLKIMI